MRKEYDLGDATRGRAVDKPGKTRITIMLDDDVVAAFRAAPATPDAATKPRSIAHCASI